MFKNLFRKSSTDKKEVWCEITGKSAAISDTVSLIKINGIVVSKNLSNVEIDNANKIIYSSSHPPIEYYQEILVPNERQNVFGRLFAKVEDEDEIEVSTAIISSDGINMFTLKSLILFIQYLNKADVLMIPDSMFVTIISRNEKLLKLTCENWGNEYEGVGRKFMAKKISDVRKDKLQFGVLGIMYPGWDVGINDVSQKNPQGHGYLFKTENQFNPINLCSNESAVSYCKNNNSLIYYNDFTNEGKLRILSEYTPEINSNLKNPYIYRSSNI